MNGILPRVFFSCVAERLSPPPHGQCLGIGKTRIIVKIIWLFLFRNLSSERHVKACNPTPQRRRDSSHALFDGPRLADTGEMHLRNRGHLLFPCTFAWQRKTQCLQTPIPRAPIAPAITRGSAFFAAFLGFWSREKTTIAHHSDAKIQ
jgi:hypothetical protein